MVSVGGQSLLQPFPGWQQQNVSGAAPDPAALWYVQSMEITPAGVMWVLDVGRLHIFDAAQFVVNGAPRLTLLDLRSGTVLHTFVFPNSVASYTVRSKTPAVIAGATQTLTHTQASLHTG